MISPQTVEMMKSMKLSAMATEFENQLTDSSYRDLSFEECLGLLVTAEWNRRQTNKVNRFIHSARFSAPSATVEAIEYYEDRQLDRSQMLRFSTCQYVDDGHHIILKGASGKGKTYIACALGNAAFHRFKSVLYIRIPELLDELNIARGCGELQKPLKGYKKVDLLIIYERLLCCLTPQESYDLLEIMEARCGQQPSRSMILCTQYELEGWYRRINPDSESDSPISEAIMDRIIHNAFDVTVGGRISMRERHGLNASDFTSD